MPVERVDIYLAPHLKLGYVGGYTGQRQNLGAVTIISACGKNHVQLHRRRQINTTLIGGLIASSDKAMAEGLNTLATGTLVTENLKNSASYKASQVGISGGYGWCGSGGKDGGKDAGLGTDARAMWPVARSGQWPGQLDHV